MKSSNVSPGDPAGCVNALVAEMTSNLLDRLAVCFDRLGRLVLGMEMALERPGQPVEFAYASHRVALLSSGRSMCSSSGVPVVLGPKA
jgi:hypothetical protein